MTIWIVLYAAVAAVCWGMCIAADKDREARFVGVVMSLFWPVLLLAVIGYAISYSAEKAK